MADKVVFLDIDGVLNSQEWYWSPEHVWRKEYMSRRESELCPQHINRLNRITDTTGAKLVLSSTWRLAGLDNLIDLFRNMGITGEFIGETPILSSIRGHEIGAWLSENDVDKFVIIDDDSDMGALSKYLYQTDHRLGLTREIADSIINALGDNL